MSKTPDEVLSDWDSVEEIHSSVIREAVGALREAIRQRDEANKFCYEAGLKMGKVLIERDEARAYIVNYQEALGELKACRAKLEIAVEALQEYKNDDEYYGPATEALKKIRGEK